MGIKNQESRIKQISLTSLAGVFALGLLFPVSALAHNSEIDAAITVHMTPQGYEPRNMTIAQGKTIAFENVSDQDLWPASNIHPTHEIYSEFDPKRPLLPGETWTFTFDQAGTWQYHDHLYPNVTGTITVTAAAPAVESDANRRVPSPTDQRQRVGGIARIVESLSSWLRRFFNRADTPPAEQASTTSFPERPYDAAITAHDQSIFADYDRLYSYVKKFGTAQTMQYLHQLSGTLGSCHDAAHRVGRFAFEISGNEAFQTCSAECHSGCYHGATELFFKVNGTATLNDDLQTICSFSTNAFFSHQCVHGIGHGLMAWTNYDLPAALKNCDLLTAATSRESCYTGVFMENVVGTLGEGAEAGHYTNYLNDDPHYPCSIVEDKYEGACYFFQTSHMMNLFDGDFARVAATCLEAPASVRGHCFGSMGRDVGGTHRGDPAGAIAACKHAPAGNNRADCLAGAVQDTLWDPTGQDEALSFCRLLSNPNEKQRCYDTIFERAPQVLTSPIELQSFCERAETAFRAQCKEHLAT